MERCTLRIDFLRLRILFLYRQQRVVLQRQLLWRVVIFFFIYFFLYRQQRVLLQRQLLPQNSEKSVSTYTNPSVSFLVYKSFRGIYDGTDFSELITNYLQNNQFRKVSAIVYSLYESPRKGLWGVVYFFIFLFLYLFKVWIKWPRQQLWEVVACSLRIPLIFVHEHRERGREREREIHTQTPAASASPSSSYMRTHTFTERERERFTHTHLQPPHPLHRVWQWPAASDTYIYVYICIYTYMYTYTQGQVIYSIVYYTELLYTGPCTLTLSKPLCILHMN